MVEVENRDSVVHCARVSCSPGGCRSLYLDLFEVPACARLGIVAYSMTSKSASIAYMRPPRSASLKSVWFRTFEEADTFQAVIF